MPPSFGLGIELALATCRENNPMLAGTLKGCLLALSATFMVSAFLPLSRPNPPRSLMLLAAGLVSLAFLSRRFFADEQ